MRCYDDAGPGLRPGHRILPQRKVVAYAPSKQITPYLFR
nr:MAG TPA: hypothetical protein [Caudoviricetes sp.]